MKKGIWLGIGAYAIWGLFPAYWKLLQHVPALELVTHRILWSFFLLFLAVLLANQWRNFRDAAFSWRIAGIYFAAAALIGVNWLVYVWAVNSGYIVESSLGYFINPLLSVLLGVLILREKLRPWQWLPIGLAAVGVLYLTITYGALPWIALTLASTFGLYGLVKKLAPLGSFFGLTIETGILFLPALAYLIYLEITNQAAFLHNSGATDWLLVGAGLVTTVPLLMFAAAAQRIPLSLVGILQYIAPTLQLLLGIAAFHESFPRDRVIGFGLVWTALLIYGLEGRLARRTRRTALSLGSE